MGIFKSIRTWISGSTLENSTEATVTPVDPVPVNEVFAVPHESSVTFSPPPFEYISPATLPLFEQGERARSEPVHETEPVEERESVGEKHPKPRRNKRSRTTASRRHSK